MDSNARLLFASGEDRPGIVDRVTRLILECGANFEDSRMALLGGEFALIVLVRGSDESLVRLEKGLPPVAEDLGLSVQLKQTQVRESPRGGGICYRIRAVAADHPGIVHRLAHVLADRQVNVIRLDTSLSPAPITGTPVFTLEIEAEVPAELSLPELRDALQEAATRENIDLELRPV